MCQQCLEACQRIYPDLPEDKYHDLLMGATAFPAGGPATIERQLQEARDATDGSLEQALGYACQKMREITVLSGER